jgi:hypothetical protein
MPGPYAPAAGTAGSTAVPWLEDEHDPRIVGWATGVSSFTPGPTDIRFPSPVASWGSAADALGSSDGDANDVLAVVSLGDGGQITLTFDQPFGNGPGPDFAVFENGFIDEREPDPGDPNPSDLFFLELAFVEVSSDGTTFHRIPSFSLTQTTTQLSFDGTIDPTYIHNLAGKYARGYGTPFDLADLAGTPGLNLDAISHVRIVDVVGSLTDGYRRYDSLQNIINDPWTTDFETGGFDLDAVAVMNIPEPVTSAFCLLGLAICATRRKRSS